MLDATPLLRLYGRRRRARLAAADPAADQRRALRGLVRHARTTRFGRDHGFDGIGDVAAFQARVPLRRYEDFWRDYWQAAFPILDGVTWPGVIPYFAVTSGTTTGTTKYIPCSAAMVRSNTKAAADVLVHHVAARPASRLLGGKSFMLGGSTDLTVEAPGVRSGDLSGIAVATMPWWAARRSFPPPALALIADWEHKLAELAPRSLAEDIRAISGTPSWLLAFFDQLASLRPAAAGRAAALYPNLELVVHGGVAFAPYLGRFRALIEGSHAELREVYPASEGFFAVADRGSGDGLRLITDHGIFYEFVPVDELHQPAPRRHWLGEVETDVNYAVAVSTCAGLWSYLVGDTVRFVDRDPPRILVTGRVSYWLNAFGEHLIGEEIEAAVAGAAEAVATSVTDYSVGAIFPGLPGQPGFHLFVVEFAGAPPAETRIAGFARALDAALCAANDDFRSHRTASVGIAPPRVHAAPHGSFAAWMKARGQLGGQHKVPRVITDGRLFADLCAATGAPAGR